LSYLLRSGLSALTTVLLATCASMDTSANESHQGNANNPNAGPFYIFSSSSTFKDAIHRSAFNLFNLCSNINGQLIHPEENIPTQGSVLAIAYDSIPSRNEPVYGTDSLGREIIMTSHPYGRNIFLISTQVDGHTLSCKAYINTATRDSDNFIETSNQNLTAADPNFNTISHAVCTETHLQRIMNDQDDGFIPKSINGYTSILVQTHDKRQMNDQPLLGHGFICTIDVSVNESIMNHLHPIPPFKKPPVIHFVP
jgi:hypothetical protein